MFASVGYKDVKKRVSTEDPSPSCRMSFKSKRESRLGRAMLASMSSLKNRHFSLLCFSTRRLLSVLQIIYYTHLW